MPPLLAGIEDKKWKVKAGCIQAPRGDPTGSGGETWEHLGYPLVNSHITMERSTILNG